MAANGKFTSSLQESILTALAFSEEKQASILLGLDPTLFEPPYDDLASRLIEYRSRYGKPPAAAHIDDVFDHVLGNPKDRRQQTYLRLLTGLYDQAEGLNIEYVCSRVREFVRRQSLKGAILEAAQLYQQTQTEDMADQVEEILMRSLNKHLEDYDPGTFMDDQLRALSFLDYVESDYLKMGIPALDRREICPVRKELILMIAPRGAGKSWWGINLAKQAYLQRWKVLYISLEMSEKRLMQRLYQSFFSIAKRDDEYLRMALELENVNGKLMGMYIQREKPKLSLRNNNIRKILEREMHNFGSRLHQVVVKQFPTGMLDMKGLDAYLDQLEALHNFVPDLLIVDYPDLMKFDKRNPIAELGAIFEQLRGRAVQRNMAVAAPTQSNRLGEKAKKIRGYHIAGDISKMATADNAFTFSRTEDEKGLGLARLYAAKGRNDEDGFTVLISQDYHRGQFVLKSAPFNEGKYWEMLEGQVGKLKEDDEEEE